MSERPLVGYLVAQRGVPASVGLAYDYVLAGDGLFIAARNAHLEARVPVAACRVRGLPKAGAMMGLRRGRLPVRLWEAAVTEARLYCELGEETMFAVTNNGGPNYWLVRPEQERDATSVRYRPAEDAVLELHSHHRMRAYWSSTDDADEQGLRLYGVLGGLDTPRPEVAIRLGVYGHFMPVPWEAVFEGDKGSFRDVCFEREEPSAGKAEIGREELDALELTEEWRSRQ